MLHDATPSVGCLSSVSGENDRDFILCGTWRHGNSDKALKLTYDLSPGCDVISVSADESSLSVEGRITARCQRSGEISLGRPGPGSDPGQSHFCLYWEPLLDLLLVEVWGKNHTLCFPAGLQGSCCTDLSQKGSGAVAAHGIVNATIKNDIVSGKTLDSYTFYGDAIDCKEEFCTEASLGSQNVNMIEETVMRSQAVGNVELPCALSSVIQMDDHFQGLNVTLNALRGLPPDSHPFVYLPPSLKSAGKKTDKVVITVVKDTSLFQNSASADVNDDRIWADVVGISVENEVITNLPEPIKIRFHHPVIPKTHSRTCVSWDTRTDPSEVNWRNDGCWTFQKREEDTECHCNHLTYFTILVQLENKPVPHLLALTVITSLGCAASTISCVALIIFLNRKRRLKECIHVHQGLAVSLLLLYVLFFLTGTLANVGGEALCVWVGAALHYALLSSFTWMGVEVFHTFWMVYVLFSPSPKPYVWNLIGFGLPAVPVGVLLAVGNIYGVRDVFPANDIDNPFKMCWMKSSGQAFLAHYCTNVSMLALLVASGLVMLYLIYRQVRDRDEWRTQSSRTFQGIWGLSVLFGSTWSLSFLNFGVLSNYVLILTCVLNSLQGFSLLLRFFLLDRMRRKESGSAQRSSISAGSTRQHMLQAHDNNSYRELDSNTTKKHMAT